MNSYIPFKYNPNKFEYIDYNKDLKNKLINLSKNKIPCNLILYGSKGSCKSTFLKCYINSLFNNNNCVYKYENIVTNLKNKYQIIYSKINNIYEFYDTNNKITNYYIIKEIILEQLCKFNTINNEIKIIFINNINKFTEYNKYIIKNITEKFNNIRIIGTSNHLLNHLNNFIQLRVRCLNELELYKITHFINLKEDIKLDYNDELNIIKMSNRNIHVLLQTLYNKKNNIDEFKPSELICNLILTKNINNYNDTIKDIIQYILITDDVEYFIEELIITFFKKTKINDISKLNFLNKLSLYKLNDYITINNIIFNLYNLII